MAKKPTYSSVTDRDQNASEINAALDAVNEGFTNTLSLDGSTPNAMNSDLDMNSNDVLNAKDVKTDNLYLGGTKVTTTAVIQGNEVQFEYETIAEMVAATDLNVGFYVLITKGYNGEEEFFKLEPAATYTANGTTVVDATGSSLQAVSTRTWFKTVAEMVLDTRGATHLPSSTRIIAQGYPFDVDAAGYLGNAASVQIKAVLMTGGRLNIRQFGDDTAAFQAANDFTTAPVSIDLNPEDTYTIGKITASSNTHWYFNGATINTGANDHIFDVLGSSMVSKFENVYLFGPGTFKATTPGGGGQHGFYTQFAKNCHVANNIHFEDFSGTGVKFGYGTEQSSVTGCSAKNIGVISFYSEGRGDNGLAAPNTDIRFNGNFVEEFDYGIEGKQTSNIQIINNILKDGRSGSTKYAILNTRDYGQSGQTDQYAPNSGIITGNIIDGTDTSQDGINCTAVVNFIVADNVLKNIGGQGVTVSGAGNKVNNNNVETAGGTSVSVGYNADIHSGTNGVSAADFPEAGSTVIGNTSREGSSIPFVFTDLKNSVVMGNGCHEQASSNYAFKFDKCDNTVVGKNNVTGGSSTSAYRIEDSENDDLIFQDDNASDRVDGTHMSIPGAYGGYWRMRGSSHKQQRRVFITTTDASTVTALTMPITTNQMIGVTQETMVRNNSVRRHKKTMAAVNRGGGAASLTGTETTVHDANNTPATLDVAIAASGNDAVIQVTGEASQTLTHQIDVDMVRSV